MPPSLPAGLVLALLLSLSTGTVHVALQPFPTSLLSAEHLAMGQTLRARSQQYPRATEGEHCLPVAQVPSMARESLSPISCGLGCGRRPQHPALTLEAAGSLVSTSQRVSCLRQG